MEHSRSLETYIVGQVQDVLLPGNLTGFPLTPDQINSLLANCPAVLTDPENDSPALQIPFNDCVPELNAQTGDYTLFQPSPDHRRSFAVQSPALSEPWTDQYGNTFHALSLKGNNFSEPGVMLHPTAPNDYIAYGLQESSIIGRAFQASDVLRSRGISTEHLVALAEPKQYPWPLVDGTTDATELISAHEYKERIIMDYWRELPEADQTSDSLHKLHAAFADMTFFISLRATDSPYRLHDMSARPVRQAVFDYANKHLIPHGEQPYDITQSDELTRYMHNVVAPNLGHNLGLLHTDLAHRFVHGLNITALGGIVDLDSVHGAGLGLDDELITAEDRLRDFSEALYALKLMMPHEMRLQFTNPDSSVMLAFAKKYMATVMDQASDEAAGREQLSDMLNLLPDYLTIIEEDPMFSVLDEIRAHYVHTYLDYTETSPDLYLVVLEEMRTAATAVCNANLESTIKDTVYDIIIEHVNEIGNYALAGENYDVIQQFFKQRAHGNGFTYTNLVDRCMHMIRHYGNSSFMLDNTNYVFMPEASIEDNTVIWNYLNHKYITYLQGHAKATVDAFLSSHSDELTELAQYPIPEAFLDEDESYLFTSHLAPYRFWLLREGRTDISAETFASDNTTIVPLPLEMSAVGAATIIRDDPEYSLQTIYTDGLMDGVNDMPSRDGPLALQIEFREHPTYVAAVFQKPDGSQHVQFYKTEAAEQPDPSQSIGQLTLPKLLYFQRPKR